MPDASPRQHRLSDGAEHGVCHTRGSEMGRGLFSRLLVSLRHMYMARQEGARHRAGVATLLPELAPGGKFLGDHWVNIDVLGDVEIVARRVCKTGRAVGRKPDGGMGLLLRIGSGHVHY